MRIRIIFLSILLLPFHLVTASPNLIDFFSSEVYSGTNLVTFLPTNTNTVTGLHLYFLTASDCYSGYAGRFLIDRELGDFPTTEHIPFSLNASTVYNVGKSSIRNTQITQINSVLIRLISYERGNPQHRFAYFTGSCQDQDINCCVPVDCSDQTGLCMAKYNLSSQSMHWR